MKTIIATAFFALTGLSGFAQDFAARTETFRDKYREEFLTTPNSPLKKKDLRYLQFYAPDSSFAVQATFAKTENPTPFEIPTSSGTKKTYVEYGKLHFEVNGTKQQLSVYRSVGLTLPQYKDYLFIPFKDLTNGKDSYGGGRYIDLKVGDLESGSYVLDFNKCYNPYCAYSSGYNCPIPPKENRLTVAIAAGEKNYGKAH